VIIYSIEEPLKIIYTFNLTNAWDIFQKVQEKVKKEVAEYISLTDEDCRIEVKLVENYCTRPLETVLLEALNNGCVQFDVIKEVSTWICPV